MKEPRIYNTEVFRVLAASLHVVRNQRRHRERCASVRTGIATYQHRYTQGHSSWNPSFMTLGEFLVQLGSAYACINLVRVPSRFRLTQHMYDEHNHSGYHLGSCSNRFRHLCEGSDRWKPFTLKVDFGYLKSDFEALQVGR